MSYYTSLKLMNVLNDILNSKFLLLNSYMLFSLTAPKLHTRDATGKAEKFPISYLRTWQLRSPAPVWQEYRGRVWEVPVVDLVG